MKKKLVFIGNSIVNGFPMSRGRSFPGLVRAAIKNGETEFHADVINKGANGETTAQILGRFDHDVLAHEPAAVFILTGTNDFIFREADPEGCMENMAMMIQKAREHGIVPVLMTPISVHADKASRMWMPGLGIDYDQINDEIERFSEMLRGCGEMCLDTGKGWEAYISGAECLPDGTAWTDLPLQEEAELPARSEDAYLDGVHPTAEGYRFLAGVVLKWIGEHTEKLGL